jgi:hypothetical protein
MVNYILPRGGGAVNPSLPSDSPYTPQAEETQAKEKKQAKVQARVRKGMGYYKHLLSQSRATVEKMQIGSEYRKAILGMIARTIDGKVIHRDEFLGRLSSLRSEIEARAQRESRSDLCYWLKRRLFPRKKICARCKAETDGLIEGLCSQCYREVAHEDARTCRCGAAL